MPKQFLNNLFQLNRMKLPGTESTILVILSALSIAFPQLRPLKHSKLAQPVMILVSLQRAPGSNPGHETDDPD